MQQVLLLDVGYSPIQILHWTVAVTLVVTGKAEVVVETEEIIRSPSMEMFAPSVIRLCRYVRHKRRHVGPKFSRPNVYRRDGYRCQYCHRQFTGDKLTWDHVQPASRGGRTDWTNIVSACRRCNEDKRDRTPDEAGMSLKAKPVVPKNMPLVDPESVPDPRWLDYLGV